MTRPSESFESSARRLLGRSLTDGERHLFDKYVSLLVKWNRVHRLTGSDAPEWIATHLLLDSLLFLKVLPSSGGAILDLGAGAGIPGIPLRIVRADLAVTLLESRQRRASFLAEAVRELGLRNCRVIAERAEAVVERFAGSFDVVVMRCAGTATRVVPLALKFVPVGGVVIVSGPPTAAAEPTGEWVQVEGAQPGETRRFLVAQRR
jgi:16S rRNA (guanine527-N7)-methyltransferase